MRSTLVSLVTLLLLTVAGSASAQSGAIDIIRDPEWQKRFLGSYGFLSGQEPQVNTIELEVLREVIELMKVDTKAAAVMLQGGVNENSSAAVDFILANLQFQNGDLDAAKATYESALGKFPDFRRAHKNLGLLLVQSENCEEASKHLAKAVELGDRDGRNFGLLGYCHIKLGNDLAAEQAYRSAILQEPDTRDWQLGLAQSLLGMKKYKEAASIADTLIAAKPDDPQIWTLQANAYLGLDEPTAAAVNLEAVRALGNAPASTLKLLGDIYMNEAMYDLAKDAYLDAIAKDGSETGFQTAYRAAELLIRSQSYSEAGEILASIDQRFPKLTNDQELKVLTLKAKRARAQGRSKEAADILESIVSRDGTRGEALIELASYYNEKGDLDRARLMIERAARLDAHEHAALLAHAQFEVGARNYGKAAELLRDALAIKHEARIERFLARVEQANRVR